MQIGSALSPLPSSLSPLPSPLSPLPSPLSPESPGHSLINTLARSGKHLFTTAFSSSFMPLMPTQYAARWKVDSFDAVALVRPLRTPNSAPAATQIGSALSPLPSSLSPLPSPLSPLPSPLSPESPGHS